MIVKVYSLENSIEVYEEIKLIRIKSKNSNLLIMEDYLPVIGEIKGDISFVSEKDETSLKNIKGYYMHNHNAFKLIIQDAS